MTDREENKIRVHIVTQDDPLYIPYFFREFFRLLPQDKFELTGVDLTPPLNRQSFAKLLGRVLGLFGPVGTIKTAFEQGLNTLADMILPLSIVRWFSEKTLPYQSSTAYRCQEY